MFDYLNYRGFALLGVIVGVLMIQACGRPVPHQESCNFVQNQNQRRVSWERSQMITLYLDESAPMHYDMAIEKAVQHWNSIGEAQFGGPFFDLSRQAVGTAQPKRDGYSKIFVLHTWEAEKFNEQARTTIYWSGDRIFEADIRINEKDFDFFVTDEVDPGKVHLESLLIHELGHALGLAHTEEQSSVMQVSLANGKVRDSVGDYDLESLSCEY